MARANRDRLDGAAHVADGSGDAAEVKEPLASAPSD
jgi:hypothetical protein